MDTLKAYASLIYAALLLALGIGIGVAGTNLFHNTTVRNLERQVSTLKSEALARDNREKGEALTQSQTNRSKEQTHVAQTTENADVLVGELRKQAAAAELRAAAARDRAALAERLRGNAEKREATTRAWANSTEVARGDLADRLVTLEQHIERGVGVVERGQRVVDGLSATVERRDAEVATLNRQSGIDRQLTLNTQE